MAHLFSKIILQDALKNVSIADIESKIAILAEWNVMYQKWELQKKKETAFEATYSEKLFWTILGYNDVSGGLYTREKHPKNASNGQTCDIGLGYYSSEKNETQAVVELKDAGTSIDRPQQREGNMTPIQQGFKYKPLYNSRWVIVSNYYEIRLYRDTYQDYEVWTLADLVNPANDYEKFRTFYLLLRAGSLISETGESETEKLLAKVRIEQELITKKFYKEYSGLRADLMRDIWKNNPKLQNESVVTITQRIIDRIVFVHFCEDRGLLPQNKLAENLTRAKEIDLTPWEVLMLYFRWIDRGSDKLGIPDGYNGGLFRDDDDIIKNLKVSDDVITKFIELGRYDFSDEGGQLSVEILGHIFEQSISDLEGIRAKIKNPGGESEEKKVSKRKKDGIFYTPAYIVDYIVRNSLGKYLEENEERIKESYKLKWDITEKNYRKREIEAYTEYQKILHTVKVLDPACGSGAFLVRVFDFLLEENKRVANILTEWGQSDLFQSEMYFRGILKNNIYGVDLNEESVEITKLSLWLKSAVRGKKLETLDNNIKCGNSLIDDPAVADDKAFNWNTEFADIMASGGFDVIVGNPPYVQLSKISTTEQKEKDYLINKYSTSGGRLNTYIFFIHLAKMLLQKKWRLGFIIPNTLLTQEYYKDTRELLINSTFKLAEVVVYDGMEFVDAVVETITILVGWDKENVTINKQSWPDNLNFITNVTFDSIREDSMLVINPNSNNLAKKIMTKWFWTIDQFFYINQAIALKWDKSLSIHHTYSDWFKRLIDWKHIKKYILKWWWEYLDYSLDRIHSCKSTEIFTQPKILFRRVWGSLVATYDEDNFFALNTLVVITPKADLRLKFLLSIFNSKLLNYCYVNLFKSSKTVFSEIQARSVGRLPIPKASLSEQQPFIEKTELMLFLNRDLQDKSDSFIKNIQAKYNVLKVALKLEKWWELDFAEFLKETKISIPLTEQEELMQYFDARRGEVQAIDSEIRKTDAEIDTMVFNLYGLTEEERGIVSGL